MLRASPFPARAKLPRRAIRVPRLLLAVAAATAGVACSREEEPGDHEPRARRQLHVPIRAESPSSLDPAEASTAYERRLTAMCYEPLLQYHYLARPLSLEPLLLEQMPEISEDGLRYTFHLEAGVRFHDDPCFPDGRGRELVARDVEYSWKRLTDASLPSTERWLLEDTIVGLDDYRDEQNAATDRGEAHDYDAPVEGLRVVDDRTLVVQLVEPVARFLWVLAMAPLAVVPREAVEHHGAAFGRHPVGTGPYRLDAGDWTENDITFHAHPRYHAEVYPSGASREDADRGLAEAAGTPLPIVEQVRFTFFPKDAPMWLQYEARELDFALVPFDKLPGVFVPRTGALKAAYVADGHAGFALPMLDFIYRIFNMEDEVVGGLDPEKKKLRQALSLAMDLEEINATYYNGTATVYDGMIPPGLDGHPRGDDHRAPVSYRGPDLERARRLLAEAGHPGGEGLPELEFVTSSHPFNIGQAEMMQRQLSRIGVALKPRYLDSGAVDEAIKKKSAQVFAYAWKADYPDAETFLAVFYGPHASPGANAANYRRPEYDALYREVRAMQPSPERTARIERMRDMVVEDGVFIGGMARTRYYIGQPWLRNFKPALDFHNWLKYLDIDLERAPGGR